MRQQILLTALFLTTFILGVQAQQSSQNATLTVQINQAISLTLTDVNPTLVFDEASDFVNGVTTTAANAGEVTATRAYSLSVQAATSVIDDGSGNSIPVNSVTVTPTATSGGNASATTLSTTDTDIITAAPAGVALPFGLAYSTQPNDASFTNVPNGNYTVQLTYTATLD
ncbi:MAG: hypothetical protein AB8G22_06675 [Saprospiraceae bacterium]